MGGCPGARLHRSIFVYRSTPSRFLARSSNAAERNSRGLSFGVDASAREITNAFEVRWLILCADGQQAAHVIAHCAARSFCALSRTNGRSEMTFTKKHTHTISLRNGQTF